MHMIKSHDFTVYMKSHLDELHYKIFGHSLRDLKKRTKLFELDT